MKTTFVFVLAAGVGFAAAFIIVSNRTAAARHQAQLARERAAWQAEKANLEAELDSARQEARLGSRPVITQAADAPAAAAAKLSPAEIIARLQTLSKPGATSAADLRQAVYWFAELAKAGPAAVPAIREFLASHKDLDLDTAGSALVKAGRELRVGLDFVVPPSLRFGLFDVLRQIGGAEAEQVLAESLVQTGRGVEVSYLARVLQEIAPGKYREQALTTARELLASGQPMNSSSPLDRNHRENLFGVLLLFNDGSFANMAQTQLVQADGQLDRTALNYLQQTLGPQSVAIAAQAYQDPRVNDSAKKEPLARLALSYVGADAQANEFYQKAINDPVLTPNHRKNLIEDLNEDGLNFKKLTERDLPLIMNRIALIEQLAPNAMDAANAAAFKEAYKDLVNMQNKVLQARAKPATQ
jgi:hypothetical protein